MKGIGRISSIRMLVLVGCVLAREAAAVLPQLPWDTLKNLDYLGIEQQPVKLNNGTYTGAPRITVRLAEEIAASGDVDGDGRPDTAVLLTRNGGGSGEQLYLAIVAQPDGQPKNIATVPVGGRAQIRSLKMGAGQVTLETVEAGPKEPACCPASKFLRTFRLVGTELRAEPPQPQGKLSLKDLEGTNWKLVRLGLNERPVAGKSATVVFQGEKVTGNGGCNRYFTRIKEMAPGQVAFGPVGATKMACPEALMKLEHDFLEKLEKAQKFGFHMGKLALGYQDGGAADWLVFAAEP